MIRKLLYLIILVACLVGWVAWTQRVALVSRILTKQLGVPVKITDLELSTHGTVVRGLRIGAPDGGVTEPSLIVDRLRVQISPVQLFHDPVLISEMELEDVTVVLHMSTWGWSPSDWDSLLQNLAQTAHKQEKKAESSDAAAPKRYIVKRLVVTNIRLAVNPGTETAEKVAIPVSSRLELTDVGTQNPRPLADLARLVLSVVVQEASRPQNALKAVAERVWEGADQELRGLLRSVSGQQSEVEENRKEGLWQKTKSWWTWGKKQVVK